MPARTTCVTPRVRLCACTGSRPWGSPEVPLHPSTPRATIEFQRGIFRSSSRASVRTPHLVRPRRVRESAPTRRVPRRHTLGFSRPSSPSPAQRTLTQWEHRDHSGDRPSGAGDRELASAQDRSDVTPRLRQRQKGPVDSFMDRVDVSAGDRGAGRVSTRRWRAHSGVRVGSWRDPLAVQGSRVRIPVRQPPCLETGQVPSPSTPDRPMIGAGLRDMLPCR